MLPSGATINIGVIQGTISTGMSEAMGCVMFMLGLK
jgi:hypothetical protein